eukprot:3239419-Rhodomonas_salina.3
MELAAMGVRPSPIALRLCYAMSGTSIGHAAGGAEIGYGARRAWRSQASGTEIGYGVQVSSEEARGSSRQELQLPTHTTAALPFSLRTLSISLRAAYVLPASDIPYAHLNYLRAVGTGIAHPPDRLLTASASDFTPVPPAAITLRRRYVLSGTDMAYAATKLALAHLHASAPRSPDWIDTANALAIPSFSPSFSRSSSSPASRVLLCPSRGPVCVSAVVAGALSAYALAMRCPLQTQRMVVSAYAVSGTGTRRCIRAYAMRCVLHGTDLAYRTRYAGNTELGSGAGKGGCEKESVQGSTDLACAAGVGVQAFISAASTLTILR